MSLKHSLETYVWVMELNVGNGKSNKGVLQNVLDLPVDVPNGRSEGAQKSHRSLRKFSTLLRET